MTFNDHSTFEGGFKDGLPAGDGTLTFNDGRTFKCHFGKDGKPKLSGEIHYPDGRVYQGKVKVDNFQPEAGSGVLTYPDGGKYNGAFVNGEKHCYDTKGFFTDKYGTEFRGFWKNDKREGVFKVI